MDPSALETDKSLKTNGFCYLRGMLKGKELIIATKQYAYEDRHKSWFYLISTFIIFLCSYSLVFIVDALLIKLFFSLISGLVTVRMFIIYHDFLHKTILQKSRLANAFFTLFGLYILAPRSIWKRSHDHHHKNNSKAFGASIGSYPIMTTHAYANASTLERFAYAAARHPLTIAFGYFTIFFWGMSLRPFLQNPVRRFDGLLAIVVHFALMIWLATISLDIMLCGMLIPAFVASALGAYLFYAQHNYPAARLVPRSEWSHVDAALHSSSYTVMGPVMRWLTGDIGFHHVHHLNAKIPFYRLAEAMKAIKELQSPGKTSLHPRDVAACVRLKLWNPDEEKFVAFDHA